MPSLTKRGRSASLRTRTRDIRLSGAGKQPAFLFAPTATLTLPRIHRDIPLAAALPCRTSAVFAKAMVEARVMKPCHWRGAPSASVQAAVDDLCEGEWLNVHMTFTDDIEREDRKDYGRNYEAACYREHAKLGNGDKVGGLIFRQNEAPCQVAVGTWMERLEAAKPGLGQTIMGVMRRVGNASFGIIDPHQVWETASALYWQGEDTHEEQEKILFEEHVEWLKGQKKHAEAKAFTKDKVEMFRETDFKVPRWGMHPEIQPWFQKFRPNDLRLKNSTLVQAEVGRQIIEVAHGALAAAEKVQGQNDYGHIEYPSEFCTPFYVRWDKDDGIARVVDDAYECEMQCGENHDITYCNLFTWDDEEKMRESVRNLPALFNATYQLERLLKLCGTVL